MVKGGQEFRELGRAWDEFFQSRRKELRDLGGLIGRDDSLGKETGSSMVTGGGTVEMKTEGLLGSGSLVKKGAERSVVGWK